MKERVAVYEDMNKGFGVLNLVAFQEDTTED